MRAKLWVESGSILLGAVVQNDSFDPLIQSLERLPINAPTAGQVEIRQGRASGDEVRQAFIRQLSTGLQIQSLEAL